ncbi:replication initiator [Spirilliplanes yamanashiensis]|uniref:Replication initiation protein n=1 Tax=Spirilliplanes yamanashiensis TaxID=42233 RepID=A0A8J3Y4H4_9ACTN|nr:replication initiator [Spirilliplanes yamanashiensis]MDP9819956.1 hypothetical protein [Spirilliplanes yamanashiensis]GIJ01225.1 replication initiation protein [Spirilliplanes yamanashiensis]
MVSTLDLAPWEHSAQGAGSNADTWTQLPPLFTTAGQALDRAGRPDYFGWLDHIRAAAGCTRPIRLTGSVHTVEANTGRILDARHTDQLPDAAIYKACGNRRGSVCPSCSRTYQRDAYQLLRAGLVGGKGVPETVSRHPAVFATFVAPSFGTVHTRRVRKHTCTDRRRCDCRPEPCHARRDAGTCSHGQPAVCWARHDRDEPLLGQPLCLDCYDHDHQAVFNLFAAELWHRTKQTAERALRKLARSRRIPFPQLVDANGKARRVSPVRLSHGKAAEMQRRGAVHFHVLVRLDGVDSNDPAAMIPPPAGLTLDDLAQAVTDAAASTGFATPAHPDRPDGWPMAWGDEGKGKFVDIRPITLTGVGEVSDGMVAGYLAKYATKSTEATGHTTTRITGDNVDTHADAEGDHIARLIDACWRIGRATHTPAPLGDRPKRQPGLDTEPAGSGPPANPYARLRRWAHMLGYGGHFLTKARRYSVTFKILRDTRVDFRRQQERTDETAGVVRSVDHLDAETTLIVGTLTFAGVGWHTSGDALLANTAAAMARARHEAGREELAHEAGLQVVASALRAA